MIIWHKAKDPSVQQIKVEIYYGVWIFLFEASWIIYGNTFIYTEAYDNCEFKLKTYSKFSTELERYTVMALIIYGYLLLVAIVGTMLFWIAFYIGYKQRFTADMETVKKRQEQTLDGSTSVSERVFLRVIANDSAPPLMTGITAMKTRRLDPEVGIMS